MRRVAFAGIAAAAVLVLASSSAFSQGPGVPDWLKRTAGWWSQGEVGDEDFVRAIQWLIDEGHIRVGSGGESEDTITREGKYSVSQPADWEWQAPIREGLSEGNMDRMIMRDTIRDDVPSSISITVREMEGETMEDDRVWGMNIINQYLGDAFNLTSSAETVILGNPGYVDEYRVKVLQFDIRGIAYSFELDGEIYEIKYETDAENYDKYLADFDYIRDTFRLE